MELPFNAKWTAHVAEKLIRDWEFSLNAYLEGFLAAAAFLLFQASFIARLIAFL